MLEVYLDSDGLIDLVVTSDPVSSAAIVLATDNGKLKFIASELILLECLVHCVRDGDTDLERKLRVFTDSASWITVSPITRVILEAALELRVKHNLRSPDAIHIATGYDYGCALYFTKDAKWSKAGVSTVSLAELAAMLV